MICPIGSSPNSKIKCNMDIPTLKFNDVKKHLNAVKSQSPALQKLHSNFIDYYCGLGKCPDYYDENQAALFAYRYYARSQKQDIAKRKKMGVDKDMPFSMKNGKYYVGDKEVSREDALSLYPGINRPESQEEKIHNQFKNWKPKDPELAKLIGQKDHERILDRRLK